MKTILRIARLELSTLFYSPIAWLVLVIFSFQTGFAFIDVIHYLERQNKMGWGGTDYTSQVFSMGRSVFVAVQGNLFLYMPLLTMGLLSREVSSGSIKLLLSSPVKLSEIVLGKFVSMMVYSLILILILMVCVFAGAYSIRFLDWGLVLSGILGLYLLICAYAAIGLFMSSLTSYQVVAAISTLVLLAALTYIGKVWQDVPFIKDVTYFLSLNGRTSQMVSGLISSKDIIYFIIVTFLFIVLTIMKLKGGRESMSPIKKGARYGLFISVMLTVGYLSSKPLFIFYYDATATQSMTLTKNTQKILKSLTKPLTVTTYANLFDNNFFPFSPSQVNTDKVRMEQYTRFLPKMKFNYVFYYDSAVNNYLYQENPGLSAGELAKKVAESYDLNVNRFLTPSEIRKIIDLRPEENRSLRLYAYEGKKGITRMFDDHQVFPGEREISAVLKGFLVPQPEVAFVVNNNERDINKSGDKGYKMVTQQLDFRYALINQGFKVHTVSLKDQDIPRGTSCLVIADPKVAYNDIEKAKVKNYIESGGNVLFAGEPGRQNILNPLIKPLGVQLMNGTLLQENKDNAPDFVLTKFAATAGNYSGQWKNKEAVLSMPGVAGLQVDKRNDFAITPIVVANAQNTWNKLGTANLDSVIIAYDPGSGDKKAALPVGVGLTRKIAGRMQRIMVFGDADFMSNGELGRNNMRTNNFSLVTEMFKWFTNGEFPIDTSRPETQDRTLRIDNAAVDIMRIFFMGVLPGLFIIVGSVILIRRKRN